MSRNVNVDIVRLGTGHSLILGNLPPKVQLEEMNKLLLGESKKDVASFGLFETSSPNYTTYYPDVTEEDLNPQDADFINPTFRALSKVIVHKQWNPIDFGKEDVLRASMVLLKGSTINVDHETATGNAIGAISDVAWQDASTQAGIKVPAGINSVLKIDGKSNPRLARGILMDPPSVHSTSVTVEFEWEQSHPKMDRSEFYSKLGTFDDKGNMYRRVVTKVKRYHEISLVPHGADPFAQLIKKDGKINNPKYAHISYNSEAEKEKGAEYFFMDFKELSLTEENDIFTDIISNGDGPPTIPKPNNPDSSITKNKTNMKATTLLLALAAQMGFIWELSEGDTLSKDQSDSLMAKFKEIQAASGSTEKLSQVETELTELKESSKGITALQEFQNTRLEELKAETTRLYNLAAGDKKDETKLKAITESNDYAALTLLAEGYKAEVDKAMPITCADCGGINCTRGSGDANEGEGEEGLKDKGKNAKPLNAEELRAKFQPVNASIRKNRG